MEFRTFVHSIVKIETLIDDLNDGRLKDHGLVNEDIYYLSRKDTAEHLMEKYEIKVKIGACTDCGKRLPVSEICNAATVKSPEECEHFQS